MIIFFSFLNLAWKPNKGQNKKANQNIPRGMNGEIDRRLHIRIKKDEYIDKLINPWIDR